MTTLLVALDQDMFVVRGQEGRWQGEVKLASKSPRCLAVDPLNYGRAYCGTARNGLLVSDDAGETWQPVGRGIEHDEVTAVASGEYSATTGDDRGTYGVVYAGTEPSRVYRSFDGGGSWERPGDLTALPSASSWSFPPEPSTHHVRWIEFDPNMDGRLFVAIEAGALVQSPDWGETWIDRAPDGPRDTHTLATHSLAPDRLYSAAGDGYFESYDGGRSWQRPMEGLQHGYLVGLTVAVADPGVVLASAASSPRKAYNAHAAESYLYRKVNGEPWEQVGEGLPSPRGMTINILATEPDAPGIFYTANNDGLYRSRDDGLSWEKLDATWPDSFHSQRVHALAIIAD